MTQGESIEEGQAWLDPWSQCRDNDVIIGLWGRAQPRPWSMCEGNIWDWGCGSGMRNSRGLHSAGGQLLPSPLLAIVPQPPHTAVWMQETVELRDDITGACKASVIHQFGRSLCGNKPPRSHLAEGYAQGEKNIGAFMQKQSQDSYHAVWVTDPAFRVLSHFLL